MLEFVTYKLRLRATIGGIEFRDCVQFAASFELNTIPSGSIVVAVGDDMQSGKAPTIDSAIQTIKFMDEVKVYLNVENTLPYAGGELPLAEGEHLIFEGLFSNYGRTRGTSEYGYILHFQHFLAHLNYSSSLCALSHPNNPHAFTYPAVFQQLGEDTASAGAGKGTFIPAVTAATLSATAVASDFWGEGLFKLFKAIAKAKPLDKGLFGADQGTGGRNGTAIKALDKMGPGVSKASVKLAMNLAGADASAVNAGVRMALTSEIAESWYHTTLWGKLMKFGSDFFFDVVPRVEDALVVPAVVPLLAGKEYAVLDARDNTTANLDGALKQAVKAVVMIAPVGWTTNVDNQTTESNAKDVSGAAAVYPNPPKRGVGLVHAKEMPDWLANQKLPGLGVRKTTRADNNPTGGLDEADAGQDTPNSSQAELINKVLPLVSRFAEHYYAVESLKTATGEVSCRLMFNVCPGSAVKFVAPSNINSKNAAHNFCYGTVMRVTHVIDAEGSRAGTSFTLSNCRVQKDAEDPDFSSEGSPLYTQAFTGAGMSDALSQGT